MSLAAVAAGVQGSAQDPPTFPSAVELVTVDAVVLDREGRPVPGLTRDDFVVEEDGKPRDIVSFEAFALEETHVPPARPSPVATNTSLPPEAGRAFAVILDDMSMGFRDAVDARRDVSTFLERSLHGGDEVILATTSGDTWWAAHLPEGREDLLAAAKRLKGRNADIAPDFLSDYEAYVLSHGGDHPGGDVLRRVIRRFRDNGVCSHVEEGCAEEVHTRALQVDAARRTRTGVALETVQQSVRALAPIRGRKSVLLFSPGFLEDSFTAARSVAAASREANAAVYFIDVRGLFTGQPDASARLPPAPADVLGQMGEEGNLASAGARALADDTGGFSVRNTNDLAAAAGRIADESRVYYLLGFYPAAGRPPGEWRTLHVTVKRSDLQVRARRGYTVRATLDDVSEASGREPKESVDRAVEQAFDSPRDADGIPLRVIVYALEPRPKNTTHVVVAIELDADRAVFESMGGPRLARLDVGVRIESRDKGKAVEHDETVTLEAEGSKPAGWRSLRRDFEVPAGVGLARVVVRDWASGRIGSVSQRFEIAAPGTLRVSTPLVTERLAEPGEGGTRSAPVLAAHRVFAPEGRLYCRFEVLDAVRSKDHGGPRVMAGVELRNEGGEVVDRMEPVAVAADPTGRLVQTVELSLDGMNEGPYELVLDVRDLLGGGRIERHEPLTLARTVASAAKSVETPRGPDTVAHALRFAPNSPFSVLLRYRYGERLEAVTALRRWSEGELKKQFDAVEALILKAEGCATCPDSLGDLLPRGRVPTAALDLPLPAVVRAAVMLHAEADRVERATAAPVGGVEQPRACPGRLADWAGRYAALLARSPETQGFARQFFVAMVHGCQWDACLDDGVSWARRGLKVFPADAQLLLDLGSTLEERATLGASLAGGAAHGDAGALENDLKEARRQFAEAVSHDRSLVLANVRLGRVLWRLGQPALAKDALEQAITRARNPRHAFLAYLFLGQIYEDAHRPEQAAADYRRALEIDPRAQSAAVALSHALLLERDVEGSRRALADGLASAHQRRAVDAYSAYLAMNSEDHEELFDALLREARQ